MDAVAVVKPVMVAGAVHPDRTCGQFPHSHSHSHSHGHSHSHSHSHSHGHSHTEGVQPIVLADNYHNSTRSLSAVDRPAGVQPIARGVKQSKSAIGQFDPVQPIELTD